MWGGAFRGVAGALDGPFVVLLLQDGADARAMAASLGFRRKGPPGASFLRKPVQKVTASEESMSRPKTSRRPSPLTLTATITATETPCPLAHLDVGRIDPRDTPVAVDRALQEDLHPLVDLAAQPADLALADAAHRALHQFLDQARREALDVGSWIFAVSAFSAIRRGSRKPTK